MKMLTVSKAKATFSGIARNVVRSKKPVIVRVPNGFIQIAPYEPVSYTHLDVYKRQHQDYRG